MFCARVAKKQRGEVKRRACVDEQRCANEERTSPACLLPRTRELSLNLVFDVCCFAFDSKVACCGREFTTVLQTNKKMN